MLNIHWGFKLPLPIHHCLCLLPSVFYMSGESRWLLLVFHANIVLCGPNLGLLTSACPGGFHATAMMQIDVLGHVLDHYQLWYCLSVLNRLCLVVVCTFVIWICMHVGWQADLPLVSALLMKVVCIGISVWRPWTETGLPLSPDFRWIGKLQVNELALYTMSFHFYTAHRVLCQKRFRDYIVAARSFGFCESKWCGSWLPSYLSLLAVQFYILLCCIALAVHTKHIALIFIQSFYYADCWVAAMSLFAAPVLSLGVFQQRIICEVDVCNLPLCICCAPCECLQTW